MAQQVDYFFKTFGMEEYMVRDTAWLQCRSCGSTFPIEPLVTGCPECAESDQPGFLEVRYDFDPDDGDILRKGGPTYRLWDYRSFLPVRDDRIVSIGEGGTPLVGLHDPPEEGAPVWLKLENCNPTSSFKDRFNSLVVSMARQFGYEKVVAYTTGNHGVSLAAYAAAANMHCLILHTMPIEPLARQQLALYGAKVVRLKNEASLPLLDTLVKEYGFFPSLRGAPDPGLINVAQPYGLEGYKTIAFEVYRQLDGRVPDIMSLPTAGGDGLAGTWKGFCELRAAGVNGALPKMLACQAEAADSLFRARQQGSILAQRVPIAPSIANSILDSRTSDHAALAVEDSGGEAISVSEDEIRATILFLARRGLCIEPASGVSVAGVMKARRVGLLDRNLSAVCVLTGSGLRWSQTFLEAPAASPAVSTLEELKALVQL
jgi:threonine synthase